MGWTRWVLAGLGIFALACVIGCQTPAITDAPEPSDTAGMAPAPVPEPVARPASSAAADDLPVSREALDLIIQYEVGGRAVYEGRLGGRPHAGGGSGGVLIGLGYSLGAVTPDQFRADWGDALSTDHLARLARAAGVRDRAQVQQLITGYADISIPWGVALTVFETRMIPHYVDRTQRLLDNTDKLHPHSFGALVSIVYNTGGGGFTRSGDHYVEMRTIAQLMDQERFDGIPAQIRAMKRHVTRFPGLQRRRDAEADLFQLGLDTRSGS